MQDELSINRFTADNEDYQTCLTIRRHVFIEEQGVDETIEVDGHEKESTYFLARLNGIPVATGRFRVKDLYLKFERVATLPSYRGQGIATRLIEEMQKVAAKNYPKLPLFMHSQKDAISFYEKLGWEAIGEPFFEAEIEHRMMVLPLGTARRPVLVELG